MKYSLNWLKDYVAIRLNAKDLAEKLTLAGLEVKDRQVVDDDVVFECEVTPNRADWLSHIGAAREIAAITGAKLKLPSVQLPKPISGARPSITIQDKKGCRRYVGILIEGVRVGPSPKWLGNRLKSVGIRSVNNVVDITNFCLMESGQPLHAFDADKLEKGRIVVRHAASGEKITTIDGVERNLTSETIVIADARRPLAVAGIMGGKETEVSFGTRRILLESAYFDPASIRRASRQLKLATDSSYRFERGVDLEGVLNAARRAAALIVEAAGGHTVGGPVDKQVGRNRPRSITWSPEQARLLGEEIPPIRQKKIFASLGCRVADSTKTWRIVPPTFRSDIKEPVDLVEELARLVGYHNFPTTLPRPCPTLVSTQDKNDLRLREKEIRKFLVAAGLDEILTYSLIGPDSLRRLNIDDESEIQRFPVLQNPLSMDLSILRPTLFVGALETVARNLNRKAPGAALFELGKTYHWSAEGKPEERRTLSIALAGIKPSSWSAKPAAWEWFDAKGILDSVFERLARKKLFWEPYSASAHRPCPFFKGETIAFAKASGEMTAKIVAQLGVINLPVAARMEIPNNVQVILAEVEWESFWAGPSTEAMFTALPKVAPATRDIAIVLDESIPHAEIASCIRLAGGPLVGQVRLFDQYRGSQVPPGKKSLAFTITYAAGDRTLTDEEIARTHSSIVEALKNQFSASLR